MKKEQYNLLIVDSFGIYGLGIASIAERTGLFESIERVVSIQEATKLMQRELSFDLLVISDITKELPRMIHSFREDNPSLRCLAVIELTETDHDLQLPNQLFNGVIPIHAQTEEWGEAFQKIIHQESYCANEVSTLKMRLIASSSERTHKDDLPTRRELEVLQCMAKGDNSVTIAERMGISENTVESFRKRLMLKFDAKNNVDLVVKAIKRGWIRLN